jgi:hypothetical protein
MAICWVVAAPLLGWLTCDYGSASARWRLHACWRRCSISTEPIGRGYLTQQMVNALPTYLDRLPRDPWGNPFIYMGGNDMMWADVISYGADRQSGGSGNAGDVSARFGPLTASRPWPVQVLGDLLSLLAPFIAFACATWWPWARTVFAGSAGLYGVLLLALIGMPLTLFAVFPLVLAIVCLAGSFHLLTRAHGGLLFTGVSVVLAHTVLAVLVTE